MKTYKTFVLILSALLLLTIGHSQYAVAAGHSGHEVDLKMAALEALITAPPERALPLVNKVLDGDHDDDLKERALFILSQINRDEARSRLLQFANDGDGELQLEAIRMIGIGGNPDSLSQLRGIYDAGSTDVREAVLESLMIAGDKAAVFEIAKVAEGDDFEEAVDMLGVMGAREELRALRGRAGAADALIDAYAISGDLESLRDLAENHSDIAVRSDAIEAMGIIGGETVNNTLVEIYKTTSHDDIREAALDGMLISGYDAGVLELYRSTDNAREKKELLEMLVIMGSDDVWELIDSALEGGA